MDPRPDFSSSAHALSAIIKCAVDMLRRGGKPHRQGRIKKASPGQGFEEPRQWQKLSDRHDRRWEG